GLARAERPNSALSLPPATIYGVLSAVDGVAPVVGLAVEARVGGSLCGSSTTRQVGGQVVFVVKVAALGPEAPACGAPGRAVAITVAGRSVGRIGWDDTRGRDIAVGAT